MHAGLDDGDQAIKPRMTSYEPAPYGCPADMSLDMLTTSASYSKDTRTRADMER